MQHGFEEALGAFVLRVFEDVFRFALFLDDAVGHENDAVGDFFGEGHFVGDDNHRHVFVGELFDCAQDFARQFRVEGTRRFVEEHDVRVHGQGAGDGHTLLLAAGKGFRIGIALIGETYFFEELHGVLRRFFLAFAARLHGRKDDVLEHRHVREEIEALEDHADFAADAVDALGIAHADAVDDDFAGRRLFQVIDAAQDRTLAGTGRADDDDDFFILDGQVNAL